MFIFSRKGEPTGVKVEVIPGPDIGQELTFQADGGEEPKVSITFRTLWLIDGGSLYSMEWTTEM